MSLALVILTAAAGKTLLVARLKEAPQDLNAYALEVGRVLDEKKPDVLVLQDDADSGRDYGRALALACAQAHQRQVKCANGALPGELAERMAWLSYLEAGKPDQACEFANHAFVSGGQKSECVVNKASDLPAPLAEIAAKGKSALRTLKASPIDYVNFEWKGSDPQALKETAQFLAKELGKPAISTGLKAAEGADKAALQAAAAEGGVALAVWPKPKPAQKPTGSPARPSARPRSGRSGS